MYKKQFKKWGFEKNLTQNRVGRLVNENAVAGSVRKLLGTERIGQYFKRRKAFHEAASRAPSTPELSKSTWSSPVELENTELVFEERVDDHPCSFVRKGSRRFRIEMADWYAQVTRSSSL